MSIDFSKLFSAEYWLEGTTISNTVNVLPVAIDSIFFKIYVGIFSTFLISFIVINLIKQFVDKKHPIQPKLGVLALNSGLLGFLGFLWFTMRQIEVSVLGARFWVLVGLIWFLIVIGWFIRYLLTFYKLEIRYYKKTKANAN